MCLEVLHLYRGIIKIPKFTTPARISRIPGLWVLHKGRGEGGKGVMSKEGGGRGALANTKHLMLPGGSRAQALHDLGLPHAVPALGLLYYAKIPRDISEGQVRIYLSR